MTGWVVAGVLYVLGAGAFAMIFASEETTCDAFSIIIWPLKVAYSYAVAIFMK